VEECRICQPLFCLYLVRYEPFKYLSLSIVVKFLVKLFSCCYSFMGLSSVLIADALGEDP
jgi:hypothetical protein